MIGTIKVKIEGLNFGKIVNALVDEGVYLKNLKEKQKYVVFEIREEDEKKFLLVCKKYHKKFEILSRKGIVNFFKRLRYYFGFLVSMCLIVAFLFSFNLFVFDVKLIVSGNSDFDLKKVEKLLIDEGVVAGVKKKDIDAVKLQNLIVLSQENISACSVIKKGGVLEIVVYPGILKNEVIKENLYSKYDAVITKLDVFAGKTNLKVGDLIKKGDLIIESDNGASGKVSGKVYYSNYIIYNENQFIKEFTGREIVKTKFDLFEKMFKKSKQNIYFSNYLEEKCVFCVSKNNFIPLNLSKTIYKEFEYKEVKIAFEEVEEELKQKVYDLAFDMIEDKNKDKITNVSYSIVNENNLTRVDCFIECEVELF